MNAKIACVLALVGAWLSGCAESQGAAPPRDEMQDAGRLVFNLRDAAVSSDAARGCPFGSWQCPLGEACVKGVCAESTTCEGAEFEHPVRCVDWADFTQLGTVASPFEGVQLLVDGGLPGLGTEDDFRCPRVSELFANTGGETTGDQPVCGPDAVPPSADDAGDTSPCCYGTVRVAGP